MKEKSEGTNTDINVIDLTKLDGIGKLRTLIQNNNMTNVIKCRYKDFTFDVYVNKVEIPFTEQGQNIEITIKKPQNLKFQEKNCNADEDSTIIISYAGEYLRFDQFKFKKLPSAVDNKEEINTTTKTIFDDIVETGITEAFGYDNFNAKSQEPTDYSFPLYYNANGIFKIPVKENNPSKVITINNMKYTIDNKSAILFKENKETLINEKPFKYIAIDVADNNNKRRYFDIQQSSPGDIRQSKCPYATEVQIQYNKGNSDVVIQKTRSKNTSNFFRDLCRCCCDKTNNNKESEVNIETLHEFKNITGIETKQFLM